VITQRLLCVTLFGLVTLSALTYPAAAQSDACADGYVWREAFNGDHACVTPEARELARFDNANSEQFRANKGSDECVQGFVWRLAKPDDHVCVPQITREQTAQENEVAYSRLASGPPEAFRPKERALPPAKVGCHVFKGDEWREVPCATPEETKRLPPPAALSIKNSPRFVLVRRDGFYPFTLPLELGAIDIELESDPALGTVTDVVSPGPCSTVTSTKRTPDSFSIQLNTNFFIASNGNTGWVQFVDQTQPDPKLPLKDALCVWKIDVTVANATNNNQGYNPVCVYPDRSTTLLGPALAGIRGQIAEVKGLIRTVGGVTLLTAWAQLPWASQSPAAVTTTDTIGLKGNWTQVTGDIYGTGCGSQAEFTGTRFTERVIASTCTSYPYCNSFVKLTKFSLPNFAAPAVDPRVTGESNNLLRTLPTFPTLPGNTPKSFYCPYSEVCELLGEYHSPK
jgi:hypothetical protein